MLGAPQARRAPVMKTSGRVFPPGVLVVFCCRVFLREFVMRAFAKQLRRFASNEQGLETVEYAVMTALIVAALVTAITALSGAISGRCTTVKGTISGIS